MTMLSVRREVGELRKRVKWMALVVLIGMAIIVARLIHLQLIDYELWAREARQNIEKHVRLPATRGLLLDAHGNPVAKNRAAYDVYVTPQLLGGEDIENIARLMQLDTRQKRDLYERVRAVPERRRSQLVEMFTDIKREQLAALETHGRDLPGVRVVSVPVRTYPYKSLAGHTLGFVNEVNADDLKRYPERGYRAGDTIGRSGIEAAWESYLRGHDGELTLVVDVRGDEQTGPHRQLREQRREPVPGRNLRLSLDMDMMRAAERAFRGHPSGAAVVVDVRTGRVRALFSKPGYDLNEMSAGLTHARYAEIEGNPFRPLIDKTVYESYFPGSTFKPISALAALEDNILTTSSRFECPGYYELGKRRFRCSHVHGEVDMRASIIQSCNVYFYRLAELVGLDRLGKFSRDFGLGAVTGLGINTEASGFVPTREWYTKRHGDQYRLGFTLNAAIGQGNTRVTLMQLAMTYAAIANGGTLYVPQLVEAVLAPDGTVIEELPPRVRRRASIKQEHLAYVIDALYGVINDPNGTAYDARIDGGVAVAGKTGTAQVSWRKPTEKDDPKRAWYFRRSHAWFAGFAPADHPELAIVVLIEHGGQGGKYAAPVATKILQEALGGEVETAARPAPASGGSGGARTPASSGGARPASLGKAAGQGKTLATRGSR